MLIYYLKIVRHTTVSDSTRLKSYSEKRWLSTLFRSRGNRRKSQGQNGAHKRTAARMSCRLTLFRMALFSFPYITCSVVPVGPVMPVEPVVPVAPVSPRGPIRSRMITFPSDGHGGAQQQISSLQSFINFSRCCFCRPKAAFHYSVCRKMRRRVFAAAV